MFNPIVNGSNLGKQDANQSFDLRENQRQRALGIALMRFGRGLSQPGHGSGFSGALGAINENIQPSFEAYNNEEKNLINQNLMRLNLENQQRKYEQDELKRREMMEFRREQLAEQKRYHDSMLEGGRTKDERMFEFGKQKTEALQERYPGAVAFEAMTPTERTQTSQELRKLINTGPSFEKLINNISELRKIVKANPDLSGSITAAIYPESKGILSSAIKRNLNQEERYAIERSQKLVNDILTHKIESFQGKTPTDIHKKVIKDTLPDLTKHSDKAINELLNDFDKEFIPKYEYIQKAPEMLSGRFLLPRKFKNINNESNDINQKKSSPDYSLDDIYSGLDEEKRNELKLLIEGQSGG